MISLVPEKFVWLLGKLIERHRDDIDKIKARLKVKSGARSYDLAILIRLLNMPVRWGIKVLPVQKASERKVYNALRKVDEITQDKEWLEIKARVWTTWAELIKEHLTSMPEIIRPIEGYAARLRIKDYERRPREEISQASLEMFLAYLEARKGNLADPDGIESQVAHISGIPVHMLFMLPRPPHRNTFFEKKGERVQ